MRLRLDSLRVLRPADHGGELSLPRLPAGERERVRRVLGGAAEGFRITRGEPRFFRKLSDGGDPMLRGFCTECGSPVILREAHRPKLEFIHVASLDDPSGYAPTMDIFTSSAQPWDLMNPALEKHSRMPPIPASLGR